MQLHTKSKGDSRLRVKPSIIAGMTAKHIHWFIPIVCLLVVGVFYMALPNSSQATRSPPSGPGAAPRGATLTLPLPLPDASGDNRGEMAVAPHPDAGQAKKDDWRTIRIKRGDSLAAIFSRAGLGAKTLQRVLATGKEAGRLRHLYPGDTLKMEKDNRGELVGLVYQVDHTHTLKISRDDGGYTAHTLKQTLERRVAHAGGTVNNSFYLAAKRAGLPEKVIMQLTDIFGWDIDFAMDIRAGDSFTVLYNQIFLNGEKIDDGNIVAAEFINRGKVFRAVRFKTPHGRASYYTPDGKSMRKAFLRTPVKYTRISSRFSRRRYHPLLHRWRPHWGVDYAAPRGTPVRATGDGKVVWKGRRGGYGKVIMLQHGRKYRTVYAHLSHYARGVHRHGFVKQGQIIGYVGMTGLATGPHLHYEFHVNGVHRNPLKVKLPHAAPIAARYRSAFLAKARPLIAELKTLDKTTVALNTQ